MAGESVTPSVGTKPWFFAMLSAVAPLPVATTFDFRDEDGESLSDVTRLNTMATVVDAAGLVGDYQS